MHINIYRRVSVPSLPSINPVRSKQDHSLTAIFRLQKVYDVVIERKEESKRTSRTTYTAAQLLAGLAFPSCFAVEVGQ